jgi:hypothetical protein
MFFLLFEFMLKNVLLLIIIEVKKVYGFLKYILLFLNIKNIKMSS